MWNILKVNKQDTRRTSFWWLYIAKFEYIWHIILVFLLLFLKLLICDGKPFGSLRKMWSYLEFSFSYFPAFGLITGDLLSKSPYSVQMRENTDQKNTEYGHFFRSGY